MKKNILAFSLSILSFGLCTLSHAQDVMKNGNSVEIERTGNDIVSKPVAIQTWNGHYVRAVNGGGKGAEADRTTIGSDETFRLVGNTDGSSFMTASGYYLTAEGGGGSTLKADKKNQLSWETFILEDAGHGFVAIRTSGEYYWHAVDGGGTGLDADRTTVGPHEKFKIIDLNMDVVIGQLITIVNENMILIDMVLPPAETLVSGRLYLEAKGGDGGKRYSAGKGGVGATLAGWVKIGIDDGCIPPGSTIRYIIGEKGDSDNNSATSAGSGGGGGTGILFRSNIYEDWKHLIVAGAGGGAYADCCTIRTHGKGGTAIGDYTDGKAGKCEKDIFGTVLSSGGAGWKDDADGGAKAGGTTGGKGASGGSSGGWGYGGGGRSKGDLGRAGGGGGSKGGNVGGTGGYSWMNDEFIVLEAIRQNGGNTINPSNGYARYELFLSGDLHPDSTAKSSLAFAAGGLTLLPGEEVHTRNRMLIMQTDGNLVLYSYNYEMGLAGRALWSSGTCCTGGKKMYFQGDGNLVVRDANGNGAWSSNTQKKGVRMHLQGDGNLVIRNAAGESVWSTHTNTVSATHLIIDHDWVKVDGELKDISVAADGTVWGVNFNNEIFRWKDDNSGWEQVPGSLVQISHGSGNVVWGVNSNGDILRWNDDDSGWENIPGTLKQVSVEDNGSVWGVNNNNEIFRWNADDSNWETIPGALAQISVGANSDEVWGVNSSGAIYRMKVDSSGWENIPDTLKQVSVAHDGSVWGINSAGNVYRRTDDSWEDMDALHSYEFTAISVGSKTSIWALDKSGNVYYHEHSGFSTIESTPTSVYTAKKSGFSAKIYPNPANNILTIEVQGARSREISCSIFNARGQLVKMRDISSGTVQLDVSGFPAGLYAVSITAADGSRITKKVIID